MSEIAPISTNIFDTQCSAIIEIIECNHPSVPQGQHTFTNNERYKDHSAAAHAAAKRGDLKPGSLIAFKIHETTQPRFYVAIAIDAETKTKHASLENGLNALINFCQQQDLTSVAISIDELGQNPKRENLGELIRKNFYATPIAVQLVHKRSERPRNIPNEFLPTGLRKIISADTSPLAAANDVIADLHLASRYRAGDTDIIQTNGELYRLGPEDPSMHPRGNGGAGWTTHTPQPNGSVLSVHTTNLWGPFSIDPSDAHRYPSRNQTIAPDPYRITHRNDLTAIETLVQPGPIGTNEPARHLPWTSPDAATFLERETNQIAYNHMCEHPHITARVEPKPDTAQSFHGPLIWINERHLIQQANDTLVIHKLNQLHPTMKTIPQITQTVTIAYNGKGSATLQTDGSSELNDLTTLHLTTTGQRHATTRPEYTVGLDALANLRCEGFAKPKMELAYRLITKNPAVTETFEFLTDAILAAGHITFIGGDSELTQAAREIIEERFAEIRQSRENRAKTSLPLQPETPKFIDYGAGKPHSI